VPTAPEDKFGTVPQSGSHEKDPDIFNNSSKSIPQSPLKKSDLVWGSGKLIFFGISYVQVSLTHEAYAGRLKLDGGVTGLTYPIVFGLVLLC